MLFNSLDFAIFLPFVFVLYWFVAYKSIKLQNGLLVISSYVFYGWWDYRFLGLILLSTIIDFLVGRQIIKSEPTKRRKWLLLISLCVNLGLLGFFKYYNFFIDNFANAFSFFGYQIPYNNLNIILPVGISFYTFQTLSYTIDIYRKKIVPTNNFIAFSAYVSFFPQLVAGPIERASNLLPQFFYKRRFDYSKAVDGLRQILWGLFKKIVIADNCALFVNTIFGNPENYSGSTLFLGAVFFAFQIYGDFSGYSDIAIGTSRLFGFNLKQNFAFPYFSRDIAEFWRRWHISLSTWFRDYLYIPLGGSKGSRIQKIRNVFLIFIISGFWHGANWTFIMWGFINALFFIPLLLFGKNKVHKDIVAINSKMPKLKEVIMMLITFLLVTFGWVFFRAENVLQAYNYMLGIFNPSLISIPEIRPTFLLIFLSIFILVEWLGRRDMYAIEKLWLGYPRVFRYLFYYGVIVTIFLFGGQQEEFIYFQF